MRISDIFIENFRGLQSVKLRKSKQINVIVGPNAIGKSTILEAVRLCKTLLANRTADEGRQVLINLSAMSVHNQVLGAQNVDLSALANDVSVDVELKLLISLDESEINILKQMESAFALTALQNKLGNSFNDPLAFTQYLSSAEGQAALRENSETARKQLGQLSSGSELSLNLIMDAKQKTIRGSDDFANAVIALLDRRLPIQKTLFSYFTADRQLPQGEQNLQIGSGDAQNQLNSYMSVPSLKYARLKQVIIQHLTFGANGFDYVKREFDLIFDKLLPGKRLFGININELGLLKVLVQETSNQKIFDIDQMSSGEKGLILTFLFVRSSVESGGVVLLDEPELHLNSSVQALIIPFIKEYCVKTSNMQFFICTHSPEIVKAAFEDEDCALYHLRAGNDLTPIYVHDHRELFDVFDRLGNSPADVLFSRGNIYVEGIDDHAILSAGFTEAIGGFKVDSLGGRAELEKEIPILQAEESAGRLKKKQLFILDNDGKPTKLQSTNLIRIHQHDRYCFENFLLDEDIIYDLVKGKCGSEPESRSLFSDKIEQLALSQINTISMHSVYQSMRPASLDLMTSEMKGKSVNMVAEAIAKKFDEVGAFLTSYQRSAWIANYIQEFGRERDAMQARWKAKASWRKLASGKRIFDDLYSTYQISLRKADLKREIMKAMAVAKTDDWKLIDHILRSELT